MKNIFFICLFISTYISCTNNTSLTDSTINNQSILIKNFSLNDNSLTDTIVFKNCEVVFLQTNEYSLLRNLNRIYKDDNFIFIFDKSLNKLCVFNNEGEFEFHIENIGGGPQEYISLMDFCLDTEKKKIILLCDKPYKIMNFDYDGKFISEHSIPDFFRNLVIDSELLYSNRSDINKTDNDKYEIAITNTLTGKVVNRLKTRDKVENTLFHIGNSLTKNSGVYYTRRFDNSIYQLENGEIYKKYDIDFGKYSVPINMIKENSNILIEECDKNQYIFSITEFVENDYYLMFNTNQSICIYDKQNNTFNGYKTITNTSLELGSNSFFSIGNEENQIAIKIEPSMLHQVKDFFSENRNLQSFIERSQPDDNPILLFYEFKEFTK